MNLGQVPLIAFLSAVGLLLCAVADALSRATLAPSPMIYWAGLLIIILPIFYRLCSSEPSSGERLALVCILGMALYGVKLARDPFLFTFTDELVHAFNADRIADRHELFSHNPLLPVTARYPGLEGATSALMTLTGMSSFGAGVIVIGAARLILMIGLFTLFRRISGSSRLAGLGTAIYAGNSNFLLWSAQFSYQSLALPLFVLVLVAIAERDAEPAGSLRLWEVPIILGTVAVVVTHHLTAYLLLATILALMIARRVADRRDSMPALWPLAAFTAGVCAVWLAAIAPSTFNYLWHPLSSAASDTFDTITGHASLRRLFSPDTGARAAGITSAPAVARAISFLSVLVLLIALPFGLRLIWRRYRNQPFALVLGVAGVGFFGALGLRFVAAAWETGNRVSEVLYIGLAFVSAVSALLALRYLAENAPRISPRLRQAIVSVILASVVIGGAIAGWPWDAQLAKPVRATFDGHTVESEPLGTARWAADHLPHGRFAASQADARFLLAPGGVIAVAGKRPDIEDLLQTSVLEEWQLPLLRRFDLRYVVVDRRRRSTDIVRGYTFGIRQGPAAPDRRRQRGIVTKFEQLRSTARIFNSGSISIFDIDARK